MLANVLNEPKRLEFKEVPTPTAGEGEIVVRVQRALTCGTDLKAFLRGHPKWPMPTLFGHEFAGTVHEVGSGVDQFKAGDAIMCVPSAPCNECHFCQRNLHNLCEFAMENFVIGAYAEYIRIPKHVVKQHVFHKPEGVPFEKAALLEPLSCVTHSYEVLPMQAGDNVVIIGTGPIALLHVILAKHQGAKQVIAIGRRPYRLQKAKELGADMILSAEKDDVDAAIKKATDDHGADKVYECTGFPEVWENALDYVRIGGSIMLFGGCKKGTTVTWDTYKIHYGQITLKGAFHYTPTAVKRAFELLTTTDLPFEKLITGEFEISKLEQALEETRTGECIKLAMRP